MYTNSVIPRRVQRVSQSRRPPTEFFLRESHGYHNTDNEVEVKEEVEEDDAVSRYAYQLTINTRITQGVT